MNKIFIIQIVERLSVDSVPDKSQYIFVELETFKPIDDVVVSPGDKL